MVRLIDIPYRELNPLIRILSDAGFTNELADQLRKPDNARKAVELLKRHFLPEEQSGSAVLTADSVPSSSYLRLISEGQEVVIPACDGKATLATAKDVFELIDKDFIGWGTDKASEATSETKVGVYELIEVATFTQMFTSLTQDVSKLCLTQAQIKEFVRTNRNWLRKEESSNFFLFQVNGALFVASVSFYSDNYIGVFVGDFDYDFKRSGNFRHRLVVLQL